MRHLSSVNTWNSERQSWDIPGAGREAPDDRLSTVISDAARCAGKPKGCCVMRANSGFRSTADQDRPIL